jgi:hypothetical protein
MPDAKGPQPKRHFPPLYEKLIPVAFVFIAVAIVVLLVVIAVVLSGAR